MSQQMSPQFSSYLETRVLNLEENQADLRHEFNALKEFCHSLSSSVDKIGIDAERTPVISTQGADSTKSYQNTMEIKSRLDDHSREAHGPLDSAANGQKGNSMNTSSKITSIPPHKRHAKANENRVISPSVSPHIQNVNQACGGHRDEIQKQFRVPSSKNGLPLRSLVDEKNDSNGRETSKISPAAVKTNVQDVARSIQTLSPDVDWKPCYLTTLPVLSSEIRSIIPTTQKMVTFHPDFIHNILEGVPWSPGLRFIAGRGPYLLKNRTYYLLDPKTEPYLPKSPGEHGAKLTAFFNRAPEEQYPELEDGSSSKNVVMFVKTGNRYAYFGNYTQSRWSDKLDHDTMTVRVPQTVKEYWAAELTAASREEWLTEALKNHFFPKPEYEGRLFPAEDENMTVTSAEEIQLNEKMGRDIKRFVQELREWKRDADFKVSLIKKDFVLEAFDRADADEPPALRLWWEYLECVDWREDFYDLLVTLQSRSPAQYGS